jgi:large subunit ribosomal protein L10
MAKENKAEIIKNLEEFLARSSIAIVADYRGIDNAEMMLLRRRLREQGMDFKVVKNTLARFAARNAGRAGLEEMLQGPTAVAFSYGEVADAARILTDYIRTTKSVLRIKGGLLPEGTLTATQMALLASLPSRDVLLAQLVGGLTYPLVYMLHTLNASMVGLLSVLQARARQLETG